jgi:hypothetical protein
MKSLYLLMYVCMYMYMYMYVSGFYPRAWGGWTQPAMSYTVFLGRCQSQSPFDWGWKLDFDTPKV